jgi:hypothetical protein
MLWSLGAREEFEAWAQGVEDREWGFEEVLGSVKQVRMCLVMVLVGVC